MGGSSGKSAVLGTAGPRFGWARIEPIIPKCHEATSHLCSELSSSTRLFPRGYSGLPHAAAPTFCPSLLHAFTPTSHRHPSWRRICSESDWPDRRERGLNRRSWIRFKILLGNDALAPGILATRKCLARAGPSSGFKAGGSTGRSPHNCGLVGVAPRAFAANALIFPSNPSSRLNAFPGPATILPLPKDFLSGFGQKKRPYRMKASR